GPGTALRRAIDARQRRTGRSAAAGARRADGGVPALPAPAPALTAADRVRRLVPDAGRAAPGATRDQALVARRRLLRRRIAAERVECRRAIVQALRLRQFPRPLALRGLRAPRIAGRRDAAVSVAVGAGYR